jgi:type II secretory pathway component PulM
MKFLFSVIAFILFLSPVFSQKKSDSDWFVKMKRELHLTKNQETQILKIDKAAQAKIKALNKKQSPKSIAKKTEAIKADRKNKIMSLLTPTQQERWQMILDNTPRRGVTDMPNERTTKDQIEY